MHVFVSGRIFSAREREGPAALSGAWQGTSRLPGSPLPKKPRHEPPLCCRSSPAPVPPELARGLTPAAAQPAAPRRPPPRVPPTARSHAAVPTCDSLIPVSLLVRPGELRREGGEAPPCKRTFLGGENNLGPNGFVAAVA